jgi:hypothetical protein
VIGRPRTECPITTRRRTSGSPADRWAAARAWRGPAGTDPHPAKATATARKQRNRTGLTVSPPA